jgi:O-antigen ligase
MLAILFFINKSDMDFNTVAGLGFPYLGFGLFLIGPIIHWIRYKPKFNKGFFFYGFLLIGIAYILPLIYLPFEFAAIPVSMMGLIYFGLYLFYVNTLKGNTDYLFKLMLIINLLMTAQIFYYIYQGYLLNPELEFVYRVYAGWGRNLGWANINDMCFYIALTFPSYLYFIFKKPKNYFIWFLMWLPTLAILLSKSRGGVIGFVAVLALCGIYLLLKGNQRHLKHAMLYIVITSFLIYIGMDLFRVWWEFFIESFGSDLNEFSSYRIDIYKIGIEMFKKYPVFGAGWTSLINERPGSRLFMYHSTFVQSLATMGIFGLFALSVHYFQVFKFMYRKISLEKGLFMLGYIASQIHGLIDNVQYALPYSILMVFFLVIFETSNQNSSFETIHERYHLI